MSAICVQKHCNGHPNVLGPASHDNILAQGWDSCHAEPTVSTSFQTHTHPKMVSSICTLLLPVRLMISHTPQGVAGNMEYWSRHIRPTFTTWKPSTSLSGITALQTFRSSICSGKKKGPNEDQEELRRIGEGSPSPPHLPILTVVIQSPPHTHPFSLYLSCGPR